MNIRSLAKAAAAGVVVIAVSGCATQEQIDHLHADIYALRADVAVAKDMAAKAQATADRAAADAAAAQAAAAAANEKADRAFRGNLRK